MNRRGFLAFLITAPLARALPWKAIARVMPAPIAAEINLTLQEIISVTLAKYRPQIIANIEGNNALLRRLMKK